VDPCRINLVAVVERGNDEECKPDGDDEDETGDDSDATVAESVRVC